MLSVFPSLLTWGQASPFIIRLTLGAVFIFWAYRSFRKQPSDAKAKLIGLIEGIAGILLVIGTWTQVAALVAIIDLLVRLVERVTKKAFLSDGVNYYLILLVLALSLMVTGAGFLARDLPL